MSLTLLEDFKEYIAEMYHYQTTSLQDAVLVDFIDWLETQRGRTMHEADTGQTCPSCAGIGRFVNGTWEKICITCKGTGQV